MGKKKDIKKQMIVTITGMLLMIGIAIFCYRSVEKTIIANEQTSLKSLAKVNAQSLLTSLEAKKDLVYAALSGDMENDSEVENAMIKIREKGKYLWMNLIKSY